MASDEQIVDMLVSVQTQYVPKSEIASLTAENARLAGQVAALREALAGILESYEFCLGDELALSDLTKAVMRGGVHRRAGAGTRSPGGGGRGGAGVSRTGQGGPVVRACSVCGRQVIHAYRGDVSALGEAQIVRVDRDGNVYVACICGKTNIWHRERPVTV